MKDAHKKKQPCLSTGRWLDDLRIASSQPPEVSLPSHQQSTAAETPTLWPVRLRYFRSALVNLCIYIYMYIQNTYIYNMHTDIFCIERERERATSSLLVSEFGFCFENMRHFACMSESETDSKALVNRLKVSRNQGRPQIVRLSL